MSDPYTTGAMLLYSAYQSKQNQPKAQPAPKPTPAPQLAKAPSMAGVIAGTQGTGQAGGKAGYAQTFLTGASGIDPNALQLGKQTLLGG